MAKTPLSDLSEAERSLAFERFELLRLALEQGIPLARFARARGVPLRTARRWVGLYRRSGLVGLARKGRSDRGKRRLSDILRQGIEGLALKKPPLSAASIHRQAIVLAERLGESPPNYSTVYAVIRDLDPGLVTLAHEGTKALRKAIDLVFGEKTPVQRCRNHKLRNVPGRLPEAQHDQARATWKAALKLDAKQAREKQEQYATWLERDWPSAAGSLKEGRDEMFTINGLGLPSELRRCLGTTNLIDNGHSALHDRVRRVENWQSGSMALRWTAVAFDAMAQGFRRTWATSISGC